MATPSILATLKKAASSENAYIGVDFPETNRFYSTGSLSMNAAVSGSIYGGIPDDLIVGLAGDESTGKTYYAMSFILEFQKVNPTGITVFFDTESAPVKQGMIRRGIDISRVLIIKVATIEDFRTQAYNIATAYKESKAPEPMFMVLDSLGNLSTRKETQDIKDGSEKRDMTRQGLIRGTFRALSILLGSARIPMIVTNHTYQVIGAYIPTKDMAGGGGLKYAASIILFLSKSADRDDSTKEVTGNIIKVLVTKSRFTREKKKVSTLLKYDGGIDKYYGLLEIAEKYGIFQKKPKGYLMPDGSTVFEKQINKNPEKYYTPEVLAKIEEACELEFKFHGGTNEEELDDEATEYLGKEDSNE